MNARTLELWIATRKGVFIVTRDHPRGEWQIEGPGLPGYEVYHVALDPDDEGAAYAAANHVVWGPHVFRTVDRGATWSMVDAPRFPNEIDREVRALWHLAPGPAPATGARRWHLGTDPGALFISDDPVAGWDFVPGLEHHPTRRAWQVARGGLPLHSIQIDPRDADRVFVAVSAGGCYRTDDGGATWHPINDGIRAGYLADPEGPAGHNPHALRLHPADPDRLYRQDHCGVYVSRDRGNSWSEITEGLPSEFGYGVALDPDDPNRAWVIPEESSHMRCVCEGRLRVYETTDGGASWTARTDGLPQRHAYVSVLRDGLTASSSGVVFGTTTGQVYASPDGSSWETLPGLFPTVLAVSIRP
ncbi:MAG: WD40/YVTN/BNR-like repeat-containing protein [Gemmatimonadota bacterium]